jgi:UDP-2-acetamido-2,6-beta-L-arabino-hexul-4-ose reductase
VRVLVTGAQGFIGRNLVVHLAERGVDVLEFGSGDDHAALAAAVARADFVFHLAGVNRPREEADFTTGNVDLTRRLCDLMSATGRRIPLVLSSSTQAERDSPYGRSKKAGEDVATAYGLATTAPVRIFRLTNVFGKWARPNYNSAVATFCHNVARGLPITVNDPSAPLGLIYIDDVVRAFLEVLEHPGEGASLAPAGPVYETTVGAVADAVKGFLTDRETLMVGRVGSGLTRALYSTFLSYLEPVAFDYQVPSHADPRGVFVEMLKTPDCGQFSYFTAGPGITRGGHYHHTKTEKFLVLAGEARFGFRHIVTGERHELVTRGGEARIVETIPGWTHDITNIGETEMVVMLWANEIFDRQRPDTVAMKV